MAPKELWKSEDPGYTFAGVVHEDEPLVENYDELVTYVDSIVEEANTNPDRVIGKLTSLVYTLGSNFIDQIVGLELKLAEFEKAYKRHSHAHAIVMKD